MSASDLTKEEFVDAILFEMGDMHSHYDIVERQGGFVLVRTFEIPDELLEDYGLSSGERVLYRAKTLADMQDYIIRQKKK